MLLAAELTLLGHRTDPRGYVAGHIFGRLVHPGGMFAQIVTGVFDVITGIFQVTFKLLTGFFPGLRSINKSRSRAGGHPESRKLPSNELRS